MFGPHLGPSSVSPFLRPPIFLCFFPAGILLWPGRPGIAQLCQILPQSVARGAWARWEANETAEPEGGKDLPARHQGMRSDLMCSFCLACFNLRVWGFLFAAIIRPASERQEDNRGRVCCVAYLSRHANTTLLTFVLNCKPTEVIRKVVVEVRSLVSYNLISHVSLLSWPALCCRNQRGMSGAVG